jgi:flagellum-specific peptidoglycan hydrolase FlgJ
MNWAASLQNSGYATDGEYAVKLANIMRRYQLWKYC